MHSAQLCQYIDAQISIARAEAASANENDFSSGSHDDDDDNTDSSDEGDDNIDNTLMFQFARENSQNMNVGRKRKHGCQISDQSINCYGKADTSSCG